MSDNDPANHSQRSWLNKLACALTGEPKDRNELISFIRDAAQRDLIDDDILQMFEGVLKIQELKARDSMIPRAQMVTLENDMAFNDIITTVVSSGHSRFPVIGDNKDSVLGILLAKDLLAYMAPGNATNFKVTDIIRPALFIPESKRLGSILHDFQTKRSHIAIVVDEYGCVTGLITIEDVIEQIVGEIEDEYDFDDDEPLIKQASDNTFAVKALTPIEEFNDFFNVNFADDEAETIGGLVLRELGRMPKRGEHVLINDFKFKVTRADNRRIYLLEVTATKDTAE